MILSDSWAVKSLETPKHYPPNLFVRLFVCLCVCVCGEGLSGKPPDHEPFGLSRVCVCVYERMCLSDLSSSARVAISHLKVRSCCTCVMEPAAGSTSRMKALVLKANRLRGSMPEQLGAIAVVNYLVMQTNELSGKIPEAMAFLRICWHLEIQFNRLAGRIPDAIGSMTDLLYLGISANQLSGGLPDSMGSITALSWLISNTNQLSGKLPDSMGSMTKIMLIQININRLSGTIPVVVACHKPLLMFSVHDNRLSGSIPCCLMSTPWLVINDNHLTGSLASFKGPVALISVGVKRAQENQTAFYCERTHLRRLLLNPPLPQHV